MGLPDDSVVDRILDHAHTIAVVGLSANPRRPSHGVARYLQAAGYRIIPVNPNLDQVLGEKAYPSLRDLPDQVDVVDIFAARQRSARSSTRPSPSARAPSGYRTALLMRLLRSELVPRASMS